MVDRERGSSGGEIGLVVVDRGVVVVERGVVVVDLGGSSGGEIWVVVVVERGCSLVVERERGGVGVRVGDREDGIRCREYR